jgi:hypothetical protein
MRLQIKGIIVLFNDRLPNPRARHPEEQDAERVVDTDMLVDSSSFTGAYPSISLGNVGGSAIMLFANRAGPLGQPFEGFCWAHPWQDH